MFDEPPLEDVDTEMLSTTKEKQKIEHEMEF
jgi:hypothetical protein